MKGFLRLFTAFSLLAVPIFAQGLSCDPLYDQIIGRCNIEGCSDVLYIQRISGKLACSRRPVFVEPPEWAEVVLRDSAVNTGLSHEEGIYSLTFWSRPLLLDDGAFNYEYYYLVSDEWEEAEYFAIEIEIISGQEITDIELEWKQLIRKEYIKNMLWVVGDWFFVFVFMIALIWSMILFRAWVLRKRAIYVLVLALSIQGGILYFACWVMLNWYYFYITLYGAVVPFIWLVQLIYFVYKLISRKLAGS